MLCPFCKYKIELKDKISLLVVMMFFAQALRISASYCTFNFAYCRVGLVKEKN